MALASFVVWRLARTGAPAEAQRETASVVVVGGGDPRQVAQEIVGHLEAVTALVRQKQQSCASGVSQVQGILADAVGRLQDNFSVMHEHANEEAKFVDDIAERIERQTSGDHEDSFARLAAHLKEVISNSISQIVSMGAKSVEIAHRFDDMRSIGDSMLALLHKSDDIRRETMVLAINATIEAARAGVHGRTFAQVAQEVRELSNKAESFNRELEDGTKQMLASMDASREAIEQMSDCDLEPAVNSTKRLDTILEAIGSSNEAMASDMQRLSKGRSEARAQVAEAVRALQFEDLARQRLDTIDMEMRSAEQAATELCQLLQQGVSDEDCDLARHFADLQQQINQILSSNEEPARITVAQESMSQGDVELF